MWPPLLIVIFLLPLAHSTPSELEYVHDEFQSHHGHNISTTERIFAEESKRLGVTMQEHALACKEPTLNYMHIFGEGPKQGESSIHRKIRDMTSEFPKTRHISEYADLNTTTEVIDLLKKDVPKLFDMLSKEFNSYMSKLDIEAKNFIIQTGEKVVLSALSNFGLMGGSDKLVEESKKEDEMLDKQIVAYKALSQSAKDNIDRVFCTRTILRMLGKECGDSSMWLTAMKDMPRWKEDLIKEDCPTVN